MCLSDPSGDPRPKRFINYFNSINYQVYLVSNELKTKNLNINEHLIIPKKNKVLGIKLLRYLFLVYSFLIRYFFPNNRYLNYLSNFRYNLNNLDTKLSKLKFDIILVEDLQLLPLAMDICQNSPIIFDVREYYPSQGEDSLIFNLFEKKERIRLCNLYLKRCSLLFTVSPGLIDQYRKNFDVEMELLLSVPNFKEINVKHKTDDNIKMVHHGFANYNRKIENMIEIVKNLDSRFSIDLYLTGNDGYIEILKKMAKNDSRIQFFNPIPFDNIIDVLSTYDIGFFYVEPKTFNLARCLPNKFFEFIQARIMVAIGPTPDMVHFIHKYGCGIVSKEFTLKAMIDSLNDLNKEDVLRMKLNSAKAAEDLNFEKQIIKLDYLFDNLTLKH
jgi:hypothetical protein